MTDVINKSNAIKMPKIMRLQMPDGEVYEIPFGDPLTLEQQRNLELSAKAHNENPFSFQVDNEEAKKKFR